MSTRSHVRFIVKNKYREDKTNKIKSYKQSGLTYRHSDGYPEGILPDLIEFLKWNSFRNGDLEYTAANWMFFGKRSNEHYLEDTLNYGTKEGEPKKEYDWKDGWKGAHPNVSMLHTGYGICFDNKLHGDSQYYYEVIHEIDGTRHTGFDGKVSAEIHCYRVTGGFSDTEETKPKAKPFAKVIFKPGDYKYAIKKIEGLNKDFKEPEEQA